MHSSVRTSTIGSRKKKSAIQDASFVVLKDFVRDWKRMSKHSFRASILLTFCSENIPLESSSSVLHMLAYIMLSHVHDRGKVQLKRQAWPVTCLAVLFRLWNEARLILREYRATLFDVRIHLKICLVAMVMSPVSGQWTLECTLSIDAMPCRME